MTLLPLKEEDTSVRCHIGKMRVQRADVWFKMASSCSQMALSHCLTWRSRHERERWSAWWALSAQASPACSLLFLGSSS